MLISFYNLLLQERDGLREKLAAVRQVLMDGGHDGASDDAACAALRLIARVPMHVACGERHQIGTQCPSGLPARDHGAPDSVPAGFVLVPVEAPESLRGQLCGYGADLGYMSERDRAVIVRRGAERWAEILRWAGAYGVPADGQESGGGKVCGNCRGTGKQLDDPCRRCNGTGQDKHDPWCVGGEQDGVCNCDAAAASVGQAAPDGVGGKDGR